MKTNLMRYQEVCLELATVNKELTVAEVLKTAAALMDIMGRQRSEKPKAARVRKPVTADAA